MRIAHFVQRYPPALGGSEGYFARLSTFLASQGHQVTVFTTAANDLNAFWSPAAKRFRPGVAVASNVEIRRYGLWYCPFQRRVLKVLSFLPVTRWQRWVLSCNPVAPGMWRDSGRSDVPFDLVHATAFPYGWVLSCGLRLARTLRIPFLVTPFLHLGDPHDPNDRTRRAYLAPTLVDLLHQADAILVQTSVEYQALLDLGFPREQLVLQGMGVDLPSCTRGDRPRARAAWSVGAEEVVFGHLANQSVEKGTVDLLRACARAWRRGEQFRLVLAGPEMPNFRAFWHHYPMKERVWRLGPLSAEGKRDFFAGIDAFAMPSRSDSFGLVFLEAWANGIPSVAYEAGGVPGVIRSGIDGLLVRCGDLVSLEQALSLLARDHGMRQQLGKTGQARLNRDFSWDDKLRIVGELYQTLVTAKSLGLSNSPA